MIFSKNSQDPHIHFCFQLIPHIDQPSHCWTNIQPLQINRGDTYWLKVSEVLAQSHLTPRPECHDEVVCRARLLTSQVPEAEQEWSGTERGTDQTDTGPDLRDTHRGEL